MNARLFARLYLDEDVPGQVAEILRGHGYDVRTAQDEGMLGTNDAEQLAYAAAQDYFLPHNPRLSRSGRGAGTGVRHTQPDRL